MEVASWSEAGGGQVALLQIYRMSVVPIKEQGGRYRVRGPKSSPECPLLLPPSLPLPVHLSLAPRNIFLKHKTKLLKASRWLPIFTELLTYRTNQNTMEVLYRAPHECLVGPLLYKVAVYVHDTSQEIFF